MANFSPTVNTRGLLFSHPEGIVLRSTFFVFELYARYMQDTVVDYWLDANDSFAASHKGKTHAVPNLDVMATRDSTSQKLGISLVNRHPDKRLPLELNLRDAGYSKGVLYRLEGPSKDAYNDIATPDTVKVVAEPLNLDRGARVSIELAPHSMNVLTIE
jgi:alpha-N-arabinofuranosidase